MQNIQIRIIVIPNKLYSFLFTSSYPFLIKTGTIWELYFLLK